jgi:AbrB family looped-hinge helix DNA binding protein
MGTIAAVTSKGQVTIPVEVRRRLGIDAGDKVEFIIDENDCVRLERVEIMATVREERADAVARKLRG